MVCECVLPFSIFRSLSISFISRKSITKYSGKLKEFNLHRYIFVLFIRSVVMNCSSGIFMKIYSIILVLEKVFFGYLWEVVGSRNQLKENL
jgi:hypothetical protein